MQKVTIQAVVVSASILSTVLVFCTISNWNSNYIQIAAAIDGKKNNENTTNTSATDASVSSNAIQLSAKEESPNVYRWTNTSSGAINPTLKVLSNTNNLIKIQNPTDTKHELILDTGTDVLPSSDDINPNSSGQLIFKPNMTGTFTYHCAYHPFTMKGTIQVISP
jgi:hypothetical protein